MIPESDDLVKNFTDEALKLCKTNHHRDRGVRREDIKLRRTRRTPRFYVGAILRDRPALKTNPDARLVVVYSFLKKSDRNE
jgi:hypothetical protein